MDLYIVPVRLWWWLISYPLLRRIVMERPSVSGCVDYFVVPIEHFVINSVLMAQDCGRTSLGAGNAHRVTKRYRVVGDLLDDLSTLWRRQEFDLL